MQALAYTNQIISEDAFQLSDTIYFTTTPADTFFEEYPPNNLSKPRSIRTH